jgi:hypothetical protein
MNKELEAKIRKAHKVYTNEDGVQMCEMEFSRYLEMEREIELHRETRELLSMYGDGKVSAKDIDKRMMEIKYELETLIGEIK